MRFRERRVAREGHFVRGRGALVGARALERLREPALRFWVFGAKRSDGLEGVARFVPARQIGSRAREVALRFEVTGVARDRFDQLVEVTRSSAAAA